MGSHRGAPLVRTRVPAYPFQAVRTEGLDIAGGVCLLGHLFLRKPRLLETVRQRTPLLSSFMNCLDPVIASVSDTVAVSFTEGGLSTKWTANGGWRLILRKPGGFGRLVERERPFPGGALRHS